MSRPTLDARWNPRRQEVTYRIGKEGVSSFLLFGADEIAELQTMIDEATRGTDSGLRI